MKLYSSKWRVVFLAGSIATFVSALIILIISAGFFEANLWILSLFLYLLATTKLKMEDEFVKAVRYEILFLTFMILFATFISFSLVSLINPELSINNRSLLYLSTFFLLFYNAAFYIRLKFYSKTESLLRNKKFKIYYISLSIIVLIFILYKLIG